MGVAAKVAATPVTGFADPAVAFTSSHRQNTSMQDMEPVNSIDSRRCSRLPIDGRGTTSSLGDATMVKRARADKGCTTRSLTVYHRIRFV